MNLKDKVVGIWGAGVGGRALVGFLRSYPCHLQVYDQNRMLCENLGVTSVDTLEGFLTSSDIIIPSAGIDVRPYQEWKEKFVAELDVFQSFFKKPIIAITGTLGKTTITTILAQLLERAGKNVLVGGNIGVGLCSLINQQETCNYALLEVSSFQLEYCKKFKPHIAIWTNFYSNHLDRHETVESYFEAKCSIFYNQTSLDYILMPESVANKVQNRCLSHINVVPEAMPDRWRPIVESQLVGVPSNWMTLLATLELMNVNIGCALEPVPTSLEHRMELAGTVNGVLFVNDSKSTVAEATLAAVHKFSQAGVYVILGGLSKGVSREPLLKGLVGKVKKIGCFGPEAGAIERLAKRCDIACERGDSFAEIVKKGYAYSRPGELVLFSPGGSSFDMFKNYQERGRAFKALVSLLQEENV